jgi:N6-adenosine-specific RNA methylase IME4
VRFPVGRFPVILADPPWKFETRSSRGKGRSAEAHYDTMPFEKIAQLPVKDWATDDAVLLLWTTHTALPRAFGEIIPKWGFEYKTVGFTWVKTTKKPPLGFPIGMGFWTRGNPELCLLATRGHPKRGNRPGAKGVPELLIASRREHSVKPEEIYERIELLLGDGPFLEIFASATTPHRLNWTRWIGKDRASERRWPSSRGPD